VSAALRTGKTYTMEGDRTSMRARAAAANGLAGSLPGETSGVERGIIPRAIEDIFGYIQAGLHSLPGVSDWLRVQPELDLWVALTPGGGQIGGHVRPELDSWVALTPGGCQIGYMCDQNSTYGLHSLPGGVRLVTWTY
jgi:hypothetical protein